MKKLLLALTIALFSVPAFAGIDEGIDKGMTHAFAIGGVGIPVGDYDLYPDLPRIGGTGFTYGAQIIHYFIPAIGLGVEFNGVNFPKERTENTMVKTKRTSFLAAARLNFNPSSRTRFYIPAGYGTSRIKTTIDGYAVSYSEPVLYAGLGMEADLNDIFVMGFEGRMNIWHVDKKKVPVDDTRTGDAALLLKIGIKF